jgi:hypothetical protein
MSNEQLEIQLKLLINILDKKYTTLQEILSITENQGTVLKSVPSDREMFQFMFDEKQTRIDSISAGDDLFNRMFGSVMEAIKKEKNSYKSYIAQMQTLVKAIMHIEIRIRLEERNNKKYLQNIINPVPRQMAAKEYQHQKNVKITDALKSKKRY